MDYNSTSHIMKNKIVKFFPIIVVLSYLILTVFIFFLGPVKYGIENPIKLSLFLVLSHLMLLMGYFYGISREEREIKISLDGFFLFKISIIIYLMFIPLTNYSNTGSFFFDFSGLNNLGDAYNKSIQLRSDSSFPIFAYFRALFSPFLIIFLPLGLFYWREMNFPVKFLFIFGVLGGIGLDLFRGTNKALADSLIIFVFVLMINSIIKVSSNKNLSSLKEYSRKIWFRYIILFVFGTVFLILFYNFFSSTVPERNGLSFTSSNGHYFIDANHKWISNLPDEGKLVLATFFNYFVQGYHALDLALGKDFLPTFGFGNSMFLILSVSEYFQSNILFENSYIFRNDALNNWDWFVNWSTFYVWVASDITFTGTIFLMFLIGFLLAKTWKRTLMFKEFPSLVIFIQIIILCLYIPANNQLFQSLEGFIGNVTWFIYWLYIIYLRRVRW